MTSQISTGRGMVRGDLLKADPDLPKIQSKAWFVSSQGLTLAHG
ncbi:hypothetical protein GM50_18660 [freshwater metagenome]|uniref:Uncharacterized protein n=1 Tax=freshwater metagenome TaxID=449393 RepID=A0A094QKE0_9ZZZZ